jgi:hypothetical protein
VLVASALSAVAISLSCGGSVAGQSVWVAYSTGFDLREDGGWTVTPPGVVPVCGGSNETWHYDAVSRSVVRTGCAHGQPLDAAAELAPAAVTELAARMASIRPRAEGSIPPCGGDATSFTLTVHGRGGSRSFASCVGMSRAGPFLAFDDLLTLSQQLDGYLAPCTPDGGVRAKSAATCIPPIGSDAGAADAAVDAPAVTITAADAACVQVTPTHAQGETIVTLATGQTQPYVLAIDSANVYWADWGDGSLPGNGAVMKVPIGGGTLTTLVSGARMPGGIAVDSTSVYWVGVGGLSKIPIGGGMPQVLSSTFTNDDIAVGSSMIFGTGGADALFGVPVGGGGTQTLDGPIGIGGQNTYGLAVDSTSVYWSCFAGSCPVLKTPLDGGTSTTLATGHVVFGVAVDATDVYWAEGNNGTIMKVPVGGGQATTVACGLGGPDKIAIDNSNIYVTAGVAAGAGAGAIVKVAKDGSAVTFLATGLTGPSGIAIDSTSVYWTTLGGGLSNGGTITKATPK